MKNNKKVLTEQEEWELYQLADIFVDAILYELETEEGVKNTDTIIFKIGK